MTVKHGESGERDVKIAIDDLVTQKVQVAGVHPNVDQEVILVTEDKVRLCLNEKFQKAARSKHWTTIAGLIATLIMTLTTAQFRDFAGLSSQEWRGIGIAALVASIVWFIASLRWAFTTPTLDDIVRELKEGSRKIASEGQVLAVAGDRNAVFVGERADFEGAGEGDPYHTWWRRLLRATDEPPSDISSVLAAAEQLFQRALQTTPNAGDDLLQKLGIGNSARHSLKIGYAPDSWDYILTQLKVHETGLLSSAGLVMPRKNSAGYYDRFRNRLIVPIRIGGSLLGFAGISLDGGEPRLNFSPESSFFSRVHAVEYLKSEPELRVITGL